MMTFAHDSAALLSALQRVIFASSPKSSTPICSGVLITVTPDNIALQCCDTDMQATVVIPNTTAEPSASFVVSGEALKIALLKRPGIVTIAGDDDGLLLTLPERKTRLPNFPVSDWPIQRVVADTAPSVLTTAAALKTIDRRLNYCAASKDTRYYLNGICIHRHDGGLRCVATDGHRLARYDVPDTVAPDTWPSVIVPRYLTRHLTGLAGKCETDTVRLASDGEQILISCGALTVISRTIDGIYPAYERVIPLLDDSLGKVKFNRTDLLSAVKSAAPPQGDSVLALRIFKNSTALSVTVSDNYFAETNVLSETSERDYVVGVNTKYALSILAGFAGEYVECYFLNSESPAVWCSPGDDSYLVVLMPTRLPAKIDTSPWRPAPVHAPEDCADPPSELTAEEVWFSSIVAARRDYRQAWRSLAPDAPHLRKVDVHIAAITAYDNSVSAASVAYTTAAGISPSAEMLRSAVWSPAICE